MSTQGNWDQWMQQLLPQAGACAHTAGASLLRALLVGFTTHLTQRARQADRATNVKGSRQFLARWLSRPHFDPETIYAGLNRRARRLLARKGEVTVLIDFTDLKKTWNVLQASLPFQGRAIPLYRAVTRYRKPAV